MNEKTIKGIKIRNSFESPFDELKMLREAVELLLTMVDYDTLTESEKNIYDSFITYNNKVKSINQN